MNVHLHGEQRPGRRPRSAAAIHFYTQCRNWHGYISAFAVLVLMFFAGTGILLNHPDWLTSEVEPQKLSAVLPAGDIAAAEKSADAGAALGAAAARQMNLIGTYSSGDVDNREALLRFEGAKGMSTVIIDLKSGKAQATLQKADMVTMLNDLHRGKNAGEAWRALIDISGALILILSLIGYILFFSMRFRFRTALVLTGASIAVLTGVFVFLVP
jgi:hypothetical protein